MADKNKKTNNHSTNNSSTTIQKDADRSPDDLNPNVIVTAKPGESAESLIKRFRQEIKDSGLMDKLEELRFYVKPSKRKRYEAKLRQQKIARERRLNR